jgi:hypothetical protein
MTYGQQVPQDQHITPIVFLTHKFEGLNTARVGHPLYSDKQPQFIETKVFLHSVKSNLLMYFTCLFFCVPQILSRP